MTTQDFIYKAFYGYTRKTQCSSVFASGGNIFSYGYHYPLLFRLKGKTIRNVRGYSTTTGRHIRWSRGVEGAIDIVAPRGFRLNGTDDELLEQLRDSQRGHLNSLHTQLLNKKRQDTQVYKWLVQDYSKAAKALAELTEV